MAGVLFLEARLAAACCASCQRVVKGGGGGKAHRIFTVSNGCVAVTAPQAAIPPAMKALFPLSAHF